MLPGVTRVVWIIHFTSERDVLRIDRIDIFTARNEVGARLYFHRRLSFCPQGGWMAGGCAWPWEGGCMARGACMAGGRAWWGVHGWGVCMAGGHAWLGEACVVGGVHGWGTVHGWGACVACIPPQADTTATAYRQWAGGTHPTGMHSCYWMLVLLLILCSPTSQSTTSANNTNCHLMCMAHLTKSIFNRFINNLCTCLVWMGVHWVPLTTSNVIHKNLLVITGTCCIRIFQTLM